MTNREWNAWLASRPTRTVVVGETADGTPITAEVATMLGDSK